MLTWINRFDAGFYGYFSPPARGVVGVRADLRSTSGAIPDSAGRAEAKRPRP